MSGSDGLKAAMSAVAEPATSRVAPGADQAEQLALLPAAGGAETIDGATSGEGSRGRGRPEGARNKRTDEWIDFYFASGLPDPLLFLGRELARPLDAMAKELKIKVAEAHERKVKIATELLPYIHQKLPQAVQIDKTITGLVIVSNLPLDGAKPRDQLGDDAQIVEILENQSVSGDESDEV